MAALTENTYLTDIIKWEVNPDYSRENVTVVAAAALKRGTVLGIKTKSSVVSTPGTNTGDGVMGAITLGTHAKAGTYALKCITAATNAGIFQVLDPDGLSLPNLTVGEAYAGGHLNMTLADGSADFIVGDTFSIVVSGDGKYYPSVAGAVDGTGDPKAILLNDLPSTAGAVVPVLRRTALIISKNLQWDASYDLDAEKTAALANLASASGIVTATAV